MKQGVLSGTLPIGYCVNCALDFQDTVERSEIDYVMSQQLKGRYGKCSKCGMRSRLFYPVPLRVSKIKKEGE